MYKVIISSIAFQDLDDIIGYIKEVLISPENAKNVFEEIEKAIHSLNDKPKRNTLVKDKYLNKMGIRLLIVKKYILFYRVSEEQKEVEIIRILYGRRNWMNILMGED